MPAMHCTNATEIRCIVCGSGFVAEIGCNGFSPASYVTLRTKCQNHRCRADLIVSASENRIVVAPWRDDKKSEKGV